MGSTQSGPWKPFPGAPAGILEPHPYNMPAGAPGKGFRGLDWIDPMRSFLREIQTSNLVQVPGKSDSMKYWPLMGPHVTSGPPRRVKEWSDKVGAMVKIAHCVKFRANLSKSTFP